MSVLVTFYNNVCMYGVHCLPSEESFWNERCYYIRCENSSFSEVCSLAAPSSLRLGHLCTVRVLFLLTRTITNFFPSKLRHRALEISNLHNDCSSFPLKAELLVNREIVIQNWYLTLKRGSNELPVMEKMHLKLSQRGRTGLLNWGLMYVFKSSTNSRTELTCRHCQKW